MVNNKNSSIIKGIWDNKKLILEGLTNSIFIKEEVEVIANQRYNICKQCDYNSKNTPNKIVTNYKSVRTDEHCTLCKCNLHAATRSLAKTCPVNKWLAVTTKDETTIILDKLNTKDIEDEKEH